MPLPTFRGDPYRVLEVDRDASTAVIKRRWRDLAREHHPDRAAGDAPETQRLTVRMARINAAYDLLRDPERKARYDASPQARRARETEATGSRRPAGASAGAADAGARGATNGPPPSPVTRPVTARFDTSAAYHRRNATTSRDRPSLRGQPPVGRRARAGDADELRASTPTGPVRRRSSGSRPSLPSLEESRQTPLEFGRFRGFTLGDVAELEPTYIDWIARTITRDRDLVMRARVIQGDMDERGVERRIRPPRPGFGNPRDETTSEAAAGG
jgi:curved DNA-binding protein CbpA